MLSYSHFESSIQTKSWVHQSQRYFKCGLFDGFLPLADFDAEVIHLKVINIKVLFQTKLEKKKKKNKKKNEGFEQSSIRKKPSKESFDGLHNVQENFQATRQAIEAI